LLFSFSIAIMYKMAAGTAGKWGARSQVDITNTQSVRARANKEETNQAKAKLELEPK